VQKAAVLVLLALAASGCAGTRQANAERALAAKVSDADISCTRAARIAYMQELETKVFLCLARHGTGDCDRYRVTRRKNHYTVSLMERHSDCVLPPS
jgi:hypothetical protein